MIKQYTIEEFKKGYNLTNINKTFIKKIFQDTYPLHNHLWFEFVYIAEGSVYHIFEGEKLMLNKGDYFVIDRLDCHAYEKIPGVDCYIYNCFLFPEQIDKVLEGVMYFSVILEHYLLKFNQSLLKYNPTHYIFHDDDETILDIILRLKYENDNRLHGFDEIMRCAWIELILKTLRKIINDDSKIKESSPTNYIKNYIEENYATDVSLSTFCKPLNYSLSYLSTKFKNDTGYSFTEYLQKTRIDKCLTLLANTNKKIPEIASAVGYDDIKFFTKIFKKHTLTTPANFRSMLKKSRGME